MVLCDTEIRAAINNKQVIVRPHPPAEYIATSALDLTLGDEFKRWDVPPAGGSIDISVDPSHPDFFKEASRFLKDIPLGEDRAVVIRRGQFLLARTQEWIELPRTSRLAARVEGRSSLARLGLAIHLTAPTIHAGFRGKITLEITNQGDLPIKLRPGLRICQLIFEQVFGTPSMEMTGVFQDQESVTGRPQNSAP